MFLVCYKCERRVAGIGIKDMKNLEIWWPNCVCVFFNWGDTPFFLLLQQIKYATRKLESANKEN